MAETRGRPPMKCSEINKKTFNRKKPETQKKAQLKKCEERKRNSKSPCAIKSNKCVAKPGLRELKALGSYKKKPAGKK